MTPFLYDTSSIYDMFHPRRSRVAMKFSDKIPKHVDSRQLREFSIKGYKIIAYSRKDAMTRLKHQKKI